MQTASSRCLELVISIMSMHPSLSMNYRCTFQNLHCGLYNRCFLKGQKYSPEIADIPGKSPWCSRSRWAWAAAYFRPALILASRTHRKLFDRRVSWGERSWDRVFGGTCWTRWCRKQGGKLNSINQTLFWVGRVGRVGRVGGGIHVWVVYWFTWERKVYEQ